MGRTKAAPFVKESAIARLNAQHTGLSILKAFVIRILNSNERIFHFYPKGLLLLEIPSELHGAPHSWRQRLNVFNRRHFANGEPNVVGDAFANVDQLKSDLVRTKFRYRSAADPNEAGLYRVRFDVQARSYGCGTFARPGDANWRGDWRRGRSEQFGR
jgi:hypothetical protein